MLCNTAGQRSCAKQQVKDAVQDSRGQRRCARQPVKEAVRDSRSKKAREALNTIQHRKLEAGSRKSTLHALTKQGYLCKNV